MAGERAQLMAVQIETNKRTDGALELMIGEGYRTKDGSGVCATTMRGPVDGRSSIRAHCAGEHFLAWVSSLIEFYLPVGGASEKEKRST